MFILIDNYDSFTYNLVQYFGDLGVEVDVRRNDALSAQDVIDIKPEAVILSPGPSDPDNAGICLELVKLAADNKLPLFGVCLGHQTIGQAFAGNVIRNTPMHGKISKLTHSDTDIFEGLPKEFNVTRYHSLIVESASLPDCLAVTAQTDDNIIMGLAHKELPIYGVQFHPESIATEHGHAMIKNFIKLAKAA